MALWTDIVSPAELTAFAREALVALDDSPLQVVLPNLFQDEVKFSWKVGTSGNDVATYQDFDTESTIGDGVGAEEKVARLLPMARKLPLSEYSQITNPDSVRAAADDRVTAVVRAIVRRLILARGEALEKGRLDINENGLKATVNFGRKNAHTVAAAPNGAWDGTSDPIQDLLGWAELINSNTDGLYPDTLIMSTKAATNAAKALAETGYITTSTPVAARGLMNEVLQAHSLPAVTVFDGKAGGKRAIDEDKIILAVSGEAGATVFGPTVEAGDPRYGLAGEGASGIVAGLYREDDPPIAWAMAKAVALPILSNPNATLSAKVFA